MRNALVRLALAGWMVGGALAAQAQMGPGGGAPGPEPGFPQPMAGHPEPGRGPGRGGGWPLLRFLGLTPEQEKAAAAILDKHRPAQEALRRAAAGKADALRDALEDPDRSESQVKALQAAEAEARFQAMREERAAFLELHALLTPDQKAKAQRLRAKLAKEREARRDLAEEIGQPRPLGGGLPACMGACPGPR